MKEGRKKENVLFNDAIKTFMWIYCVRRMFKDNSDNKKHTAATS